MWRYLSKKTLARCGQNLFSETADLDRSDPNKFETPVPAGPEVQMGRIAEPIIVFANKLPVCLKHEEIKTEVSPLPFSKHIQVWLHVSMPAKVSSGATLPMQAVWPNILNPAASLTLGTGSCSSVYV
jgi:hypothetical protein